MSNQYPWRTTSSFDGVMEGESDTVWADFVYSLHAQVPKMISDGITDGWIDAEVVDGKTIVHRYWATEEAAQVWVNLVTAKPLKNGIIPTCVIDNIATP